MKNLIVSLIALAALTGGAFADDSSNGQSGRDIASSIISPASASVTFNKAAVVYTSNSARSARKEAGNGYASHNLQ